MKNEVKGCKECGKPLPRGNSLISRTARELGYCRYCYRMNVSDAPEVDEVRGAEVFDPEEPWNWYEYFFPEEDR